ncbi:hypothetical protein [Candidatus Thiothrix anitrata]|uniref:Uncharacterized protein n=1 Tax=Candidatus Thiothrix anitrata TaxID=2823902 RepID=A0ABX7X8T0_9GAMM|nr:hypothetical protein [Candidatus Thiothrix anitrata]QTR51624.1 hypothetical protein J8380_08815 [Candidatus Thiothrix anitrata]
MTLVTVLFARPDSVYKNSQQPVDVWDAERNALNWQGGTPVVAHPPCRAWSQLRYFAKPVAGEKELALWAVAQVRQYGGVLEHPARSQLWPVAGLPKPSEKDEYGGWTYEAPQKWWGHRCEKPTRFYIVGCSPANMPEVPFVLGEATHVQTYSHRCRRRPQITRAEREHTPPRLAEWLITLASRCKVT